MHNWPKERINFSFATKEKYGDRGKERERERAKAKENEQNV